MTLLFNVLIIALVGVSTQALSSQDIRDDCLNSHNKLRALHVNTPAMTWDSTLAEGAEAWAKHIAALGGLQHAKQRILGENLYMSSFSSPKEVNCAEASLSWYDEIKDYSYTTTSSLGGPIGHFTQLVWRSSLRVGVGKATVKSNGMYTTYYVARYAPQGNFVMMEYGESYEGARERVYKNEVMPRKAGAVTPTLSELVPAVAVKPTPKPSPPPAPSSSCRDVYQTEYCLQWQDKGFCELNSPYYSFMKNKCSMTCRHCSARDYEMYDRYMSDYYMNDGDMYV